MTSSNAFAATAAASHPKDIRAPAPPGPASTDQAPPVVPVALDADSSQAFAPATATMTSAIAHVAEADQSGKSGESPPGSAPASERGSSALPPQTLFDALWRDDSHTHWLGLMKRGGNGGFENKSSRQNAEALVASLEHSRQGLEVYLACAEYASTENRKADNVVQAYALWMDLDCGADKEISGKGYASIADAHTALLNFCAKAKLPAPTHEVNSGGGLHVYWVLDEPLDKKAWQKTAGQLKALAAHHGLLADPTRTADIASVLRVPGTQNHKYSPSRPVELIKAAPYLSRDDLVVDIHSLDAEIKVDGLFSKFQEMASSDDAPSKPAYGPPDLESLASALSVLDPDCDEATWKLQRLAPVARAARDYPDMAKKLKDIAKRWSSGDLQGKPSHAWNTPGTNGVTGEAAFATEWKRFMEVEFSGKPVTLGTIFHDAKQAGWEGAAQLADPIDPRILEARQTVARLMINVVKDCGAPLQEENISALQLIRDAAPAEFQRIRFQLKQANKQVSFGALDGLMKISRAPGHTAPTHHGYANGLIKSLTVDGHKPVGHEGSLFVLNKATSLWMRKEPGTLDQAVAEFYDGKENCTRRSDYSAIALHAIAIVGSESFFADAPVGLACAGMFYRLAAEKTIVEPLAPSHRQRVSLNFSPAAQPTPLFDAFLHETFNATLPGEEQQQIALVQEIAGAVMLGLMHRHHKAVLFYDPYGRAGKGTLESILRELIPPNFVTAVSPFAWNKEYFVATLAGSRLNVVGELPENEPIPASNFKSVIGGDLITGRNPTHRPISFKNEAAHIFTSNHLITSRDHSEAFFARWLIIEFPNSRLKSGLPLDPGLAARIIDSELPGIAHWALEGAARLLRKGAFSSSTAHVRLMAKWRRSNSSLEEFIEEDCDLVGQEHFVLRSDFYTAYRNWCVDAGRKPFTKIRVKEMLEHNVSLSVKHAKKDGYEVFRGLQFKQVNLVERGDQPADESQQKPRPHRSDEVKKVDF